MKEEVKGEVKMAKAKKLLIRIEVNLSEDEEHLFEGGIWEGIEDDRAEFVKDAIWGSVEACNWEMKNR